MLPGLSSIGGTGVLKGATYAHQGTAQSGSANSTYTFSTQPFGAATTDRVIIVPVFAVGGTPGTISSVTIGGESASILTQVSDGALTGGLVAAAVPTGVTGNVVVNLSSSRSACAIAIYSSTGLAGATAVQANSNINLAALALTADPGGFVIAACASGFERTTSWSGVTQDATGAFDDEDFSVASAQTLTTGVTVQPSLSGGFDEHKVFLAATF